MEESAIATSSATASSPPSPSVFVHVVPPSLDRPRVSWLAKYMLFSVYTILEEKSFRPNHLVSTYDPCVVDLTVSNIGYNNGFCLNFKILKANHEKSQKFGPVLVEKLKNKALTP